MSDNGEYGESLKKFHRTAFNPHKAQDAVVLKEAPLPVLLLDSTLEERTERKNANSEKYPQANQNMIGQKAGQFERNKKAEAIKEMRSTAQHAQNSQDEGIGSAASVAAESSERSQSAVVKDGLGASIASAAKAGASLGEKLANGGRDEDLIGG